MLPSQLGALGDSGGIAGIPLVGMSHRYTVLIDNVAYHFGDWSRVTGLSVSWQQIEHRVGDQGNQVWIFPGTTKYEPITLSRAAGPYSRVVQYWLTQTSKNPEPQSGTIQLVDYVGIPLVQWRLTEFFPIAWSVDSFEASGAKPAIETLKLAHSGFLEDELNSAAPPAPPSPPSPLSFPF
jgi:phage tail-like protein